MSGLKKVPFFSYRFLVTPLSKIYFTVICEWTIGCCVGEGVEGNIVNYFS